MVEEDRLEADGDAVISSTCTPKAVDGVGVPLVGENAALSLHVPQFHVCVYGATGYEFTTRMKVQTSNVGLRRENDVVNLANVRNGESEKHHANRQHCVRD